MIGVGAFVSVTTREPLTPETLVVFGVIVALAGLDLIRQS
jgi:hypothetical protein